ncbi:tRNA (5-methylaminomethyl-2-thiouridylate)-methyltransferase [Halobacteriovorax marinus SJ]|uniref:tRNA-specific 2-thiouridylase MnmA n=1 Tax=Halobacteriovorax marinus (strain ATCC BAA-682 / DSM 15412 / SJ) TaxID=862908 RepID=E1X2G4_HALMS|nr:tRNA 2-thiouridine(34) synthase MnmA [Halobacteriovorax marinus]CBW26731.1 tRNA (5-methylaminomethyl-2-thiouridylate)-methyltransferase [Halobacteriovorax marinus SJ]
MSTAKIPNQKKSNEETTVIVGMSGGVDSSVCAAVLKEQGYNVIGMFMKNWEEQDENGVCQSSKEYADVISVCEKLDIPYYSVDFVKEYRDNVFQHFLDEYEAGFTPNPDILCNREIKFKVFLNKALELGADYLATGHYCQNILIDGENHLVKGNDPGKDQTYFLYTMKKEKLEHVHFPIGHLPKTEVRKLAEKFDLSTKHKKDSTGICFIGERNFKNFLSNYIQIKPGKFETLSGEEVGEHSGSAYYTIGQRKGLGLGGPGAPWFVVGKDTKRNVVIVERGEDHPALFFDELWADEISWVSGEFKGELPLKCKAKIRYRQEDQDCTITKIEDGELHVQFDQAQRAVALRQSIVFYTQVQGHAVCLGGAMISRAGKSHYEQGQ